MQAGAPGPRPTRPGHRAPPRPRYAVVWAVAIAAAVALSGYAAAGPLRVGTSLETLGGSTSDAAFLSHWVFVGASAGVTPLPVPRVWSTTVALPTRLGRLSQNALLNAGTAGHVASVWTFNETIGIAASTELEIDFVIDYEVGTTAHTFTETVYVETSARALLANAVISVYWDSGGTGAITYLSEFEFTQVCSAVGTCP